MKRAEKGDASIYEDDLELDKLGPNGRLRPRAASATGRVRPQGERRSPLQNSFRSLENVISIGEENGFQNV